MCSKIYFIFKKNFITDEEGEKKFKNITCSLINKIFSLEKIKYTSITLVFCDDVFIKDYNKKYLNHNYETDIITFYDRDATHKIEAELLISIDTIKINSGIYKTSFKNELNRVIIHGILHLCGYKDKTTTQKSTIKKKESYYLNQT